MTNRVQTVRSNVSGNRPTGRPPGELYVNWADGQIGTITPANAAQDLIPVRFFSTAANYVVGDFVVQTGQLYRAVAPSTPGAFKPANWSQIGGSITTGDVAPTTPQPGTLWWDSVGGQLYVWYTDANSSQWIIAVNTANFPSITVGATPPINPVTGDMWWDSIGAQLYIRYADANSSQWVPTTNQMGGGYMPLKGVTDGSSAAPGMVGEVIEVIAPIQIPMFSGVPVNAVSISLPPGNWDLTGEVDISVSSSLVSAINGWIGPFDAQYPGTMNNASSYSINFAQELLSSCVIPLRTVRVSLAAGTTYYLGAQTVFTTAACACGGLISARRVR